MFVAVVYKYHPDTEPDSHKDHGGWESFLAETKEGAIEKAILAAQRWENQPKSKLDQTIKTVTTKYYGPYQILVGELTEEAKRTNYTVIKATDPFGF